MFPERAFGQLRPPQASQVAEYAATLGWHLSDDELSSYTEQIAGSLLSLDRVEELDESTVELKHPYRDPGRPPRAGEDPGLSVPGGTGEGNLPIGLQIIGRHFAEDLIHQTGFALEGA